MTRVVGVTWGDPWSIRTYSGYPWQIFAELDRCGDLVDRADAAAVRLSDAFTGFLDLPRSLRAGRPRESSLWRYFPETISRMTTRFRASQADLAEHDVTLQFGVAGVPDGPLVAHVEIPVEMAVSNPVFASSYGFSGFSGGDVRRAVSGEREFLDRCHLVWTNTAFTAAALEAQGVAPDRLRVLPPVPALADPGPISRDWSELHILFIGKDWVGKGGPLLLDAFEVVREHRPAATLTVVGCSPRVRRPGVEILGFLRKDRPEDAAALQRVLRRSTVFCMPSYWESVGIVYMEAALYGLPLVMLAGQGREELFPPEVAHVLGEPDVEALAGCLLEMATDPDGMRAMGGRGRAHVAQNYSMPQLVRGVREMLAEAESLTAR